MPHKLFFGERVLAFAQSREMVIADSTLQAPLLGKPALPLTETLLVAAPVVLPLRRALRAWYVRAWPAESGLEYIVSMVGF